MSARMGGRKQQFYIGDTDKFLWTSLMNGGDGIFYTQEMAQNKTDLRQKIVKLHNDMSE